MIIAAPRTTTTTTNNTVRTRSNIIQLSATSNNNNNHYTLQSSSTTTLRTKAKRVITNLHHRIRTIFLHQLSNVITHKKFKLVMLSTMLAITTALVPQCAVAKSSSLFSSLSSSSSSGGAKDTKTSIIVVPSSSSGSSTSTTMKKVGKVVVTIGAIGAGASTANVMRSKLFACSGDGEDQEDDDNESVVVNGKKSPINGNVPTMNKGATNNNSNSKAEIEPLSEEWIQQQLNDAEKRSNVLNDVIKMTQLPQSKSTVAAAAAATTTKVTKNTNGTTKSSTKVNGNSRTTTTNKKKVSVDNTIGIQSPTKSTTTTTTPLVKNLDSKIEMLQRREAERTKEQQRINDEQAQVQMEQKKVAIVEAQQKIELAEKEYRQRSQLQQQVQVVVEDERKDDDAMINSTPSSSTTTRLAIKVGPGGSPAKSKEEDLELTTQVILEHVNSMDSMSHGVVDDDDE
eukprot:scaffold2479_cov153-Skeletonema_menzelii.AAC.3